ncbi:MAG: hypothetical protein K2X77_09990 [Candidatus Obscuribacterales bacterium]|nr:hypothetical protein [Candidatus Obscuribacterales bacterium]
MTSKSFLFIVGTLLITLQLCTSALAQEAGDMHHNLDLSSENRTVTAGSGNNNFTSATITVGGSSVVVNAGSLLTPAESVALNQVLGGGTQSLVLDASGRAVGGQFNLSGNNLSQVVIPTGVTAVRDFGTAGSITITGNLSNAGNLFAISSNSQFNTALISAANIFNNQGGLLSSIVPMGGFESLGFTNLLSSVNLSLNTTQNIVNYGSITSSGNLNLNAGGSIINALPAGLTGPSPVMQAVGDISMITNSVQNAGLIASLNANINVATMLAQNLAINNIGGTFEALNGAINIRDQFFTPKFDTKIFGGDFVSQTMNVFSGDGTINMDVNSVSGQLNLVGGAAHVSAVEGDLHIGALTMTGDPTIASGGDIYLEMSQFGGNWVFPGNEALIITAGKNIINVDVSAIGTSGKSGNTGNIVLTAGGMIDLGAVPLTISTESNNGNSGSITLTAGGPILLGETSISSKSTGGQSGAITITSNNSNVSATGLLSIDSSSSGNSGSDFSINAKTGIDLAGGIKVNTSSDVGFAGSVNFITDAGDVVLGNNKTGASTDITATSQLGTGGQVYIQTLNGFVHMGNGTIDLTSSQNGGGGFSVFADRGSINFGDSTIDVSGFNGGFVSLLTLGGEADINMSDVDIKANASSSGFSGFVSISSGLNGAFDVTSDNVSVGNIQITGGDSTGSSVSISTSVNDIQVASINSNGASVNLSAGANIRVDSINNDNPTGLGAFININANNNSAPDAVSSTLFVNQAGGNNYIGSTSANSAGGGGLFINNHGLGGIHVGSVALNASVGDAGMISLVADGEIVLTGASYSANGGASGAGGQISISSGTKVSGGDLNFSAVGGTGYAGGSLAISAPILELGSLTADTSGHGSGSAGSIGIGGDVISASSMNLTNNGGGATTVQIAGSVQVDTLAITARGGDDPGKNGGNIMITLTDGVHGAMILDASGAASGSGGDITITSLTDLDLAGSASMITSRGGNDGGNGGFLFLNSNGTMNLSSSQLNVSPQAANGNGGSMYIVTGLDSGSASGALNISGTLNADGSGTGNGGTISITTLNTQSQGDFSVSKTSGFSLSARSGLNGGAGGTINISAGGDLDVDGAFLSVAARGSNGDGGIISLTANAIGSGQVGSGNNLLTITGLLSADGAGSGDGGQVNLGAPQINIMDGSTVTASTTGSGNGGSITVTASGNDADLTVGNGSIMSARSASGDGGSIALSTSRNLSLAGSLIDAGSMLGSGGDISLTAGVSSAGELSIDADVVADGGGSGNGGLLAFAQNSQQALQLGALNQLGGPGSGLISASAMGSGNGGTLSLDSGAGNALSVAVNQNVFLSGASSSNLGTIDASSQGAVSVSGPASLKGSFQGSGSTYSVNVSGAGSVVGVSSVSSTNGNVLIQASAGDSSIAFANNSTLSASQGAVELGAPQISFLGNSSVSMDTAGLMKIHSGNAGSSLAMNFNSGSKVTFNIDQGTAVRPGNVLIGPAQGSTTISANGAGANIDFTNATVSITSVNGAATIGDGIDISSTAFDESINLGMEVISTNGDINLNGAISARQLDVSAIAGGNINIGNNDINAPVVNLTVQGGSSINQVGDGTIGIGTLVLSSGTGDIGSALNPLLTNVLEMKATSGGSTFVSNSSSFDLRTSSVAGTLQLNGGGDVSVESSVSAGNLIINADGSISIFENVNGSNGVTLASGSGNDLTVASGIDVQSTAGSLSLTTDNLILDGRLLAQSSGNGISISSSSDLNLSGTGAQVLAGSGGISINGDSVNFGSNYILNAGNNGVVNVSTGSSGNGVSLASSSLSINGGSQLSMNTNALNLSSGSIINLSRTTSSAMYVSSTGSGLSVNVTGSSTLASQGGSVEFHAGTPSPLTFQAQGPGSAQLNVTGGTLVTESSAADTNLNNVDLMASGNVEVNVHGGNLNLNGDIYSSKQGGVIVLQDPNGMTLTGAGTVGFTGGNSGSIFVQSFGAGNDLTFAGNTVFNAGSGGSVAFSSQSSLIFAAGSNSTINSGAALSISAPTVAFGDGSNVTATGASAITVASQGGGAVNIVTPTGSTGTLSTAGGSISINGAGSDINFSTSGGAGNGTLAMLGAPVLIETNNADVTINSGVVLNSDHNVSVLTPGGNLINNGLIQTPNGTTTIQAAGNLVIDKNVSANSLIIQTTANNGNITLGANVDVTNDLLVSAHGSGNITQTAGTLTAANITLKSGSGSIGTTDRAIQVNTPSLSISTAGSANVSDSSAVRLESIAVGRNLIVKAVGTIDVGAANASSVSINSNSVFNAGVNGSVNIAASDSVTIGKSVSVQDSALNVSAALVNVDSGAKLSTTKGNLTVNGESLSIAQNSTVSSGGALTVNSDITGTDFTVRANKNLALNGDVTGRVVNVQTKSNGNITFGGDVNATTLKVDAHGTGNISQTGGVLSASSLLLESDTGNIGSKSVALQVNASNLQLRTQQNGIVNVNATGNVTVLDSESGGNFSVSSQGGLTVNNVTTRHGSIMMSSGSSLVVAKNAKLVANEGNLTLQSRDTSHGTITIGKNADLQAFSNSANSGRGNVYVVIGDVPTSPIEGKTPSGVKVSEKYGGQVYFGKNGITAEGNNNQIKAWGSNVVFSTGTRSKSAIVLEGGVHILADPPVAETSVAGGAVSSITVSAIAPQALVLPSTSMPSLNVDTSRAVIFSSQRSTMADPGLPQSDETENEAIANGSSSEGSSIASASSELKPIACLTPVLGSSDAISASSNIQRASITCFDRAQTETCSIITAACDYESSSAKVAIHKGEMICDAHKNTHLTSKFGDVELGAGTTALVRSNDQGLEIFNIYENRWGGIKVKVGDRHFVVGAGQSLQIGKTSKVASRNEKEHKLETHTVKTAEFSILSLFSQSDVLAKVMKSPTKQDRQLGARVFKMAACLSLVTQAHGLFKTGN